MCSPYPARSSTARTTLLLASVPSLSAPTFLSTAIRAAANEAKDRLVIVLFSRLFKQRGAEWDDVQRLLTFVYVLATKVAQETNKILLDVDVLLRAMHDGIPDLGDAVEIVFRVRGDCLAAALPVSLATLRQRYVSRDEDIAVANAQCSDSEVFPVVALGGTFDHLHAGHKILLSMALWITGEKIIVGVTDDELLKSKAHKHVLENITIRKTRVRKFMSLFLPGLTYDVVTLSDVYGPTGWDPNVQALVVSHETLSGAKAIASHRESESLPPLKTFVIDVISPTSSKLNPDDAAMLKQTKMSSTFIREWIANNGKDLFS